MICRRLALVTMLLLTTAACGPKGDGGSAAPAGDGGAAGGAPAAQNGAPAGGDKAGGDAAGGAEAVGAGAAVSGTAPVGMISSGAAERPTDQPTTERPVQQGDSKMMERAELLKTTTVPLFELPRESDDDQFSYYWVTARDGAADPTLPMARMVVTLNYTNAFVLTQWAAKDGAEVAEEGESADVTVGGAPGKLWTVGKKTVIAWDNGATRLRIQSNTFDKNGLLGIAAKLVPMK